MSRRSRDNYTTEPKSEATVPPHSSGNGANHGLHLPRFNTHGKPVNHNGHEITRGIAPEGESGRKGIHPLKFLRICFRSSSRMSLLVNFLWPVVPVAIALHFARPEWHLAIFITNYIAMVPAANLVGFAGQELARKLPKVLGVVLETTFGSIVEIVLFMVLIKTSRLDANGVQSNVPVIRAAILGSILANMLLCLGACFFVGGLKREDQEFHEAISEAGSGLMLVAGMGLVLPTVFANALASRTDINIPNEVVKISRATAIILLVAFFVYQWFQTKTHDGLYGEIFEMDEHKDADRKKDLAKDKLTLTECVVALLIALACVSLIAVFLVLEIPFMVEERGIKDAFIGLILIPVVEKAAEHLTAIDEAWDNQMNFALAHVLGASIQTALLNTPLVVIVGWGLDKGMDLNFNMFDAVALILAILVVGSFLRDGKSNYLEGTLCILVYIVIAICAFYYPNPPGHGSEAGGEGGGEGH
ncbi:Ca2+:H+ antiporter [Lophiotrema nucula]|uniref:Vacuolar calcium ion transporter n=1 Tax=Lophiotrema nucula TaxID=690887 RepID=A0A6A5Z1H1_9PLEO|nr:Ca2+:H+ antiporter [Lophiotrema nucula]